jgi:4-amino-4-deoxy-L-arabinose transferase-like glycosyltransferase
VFFCQAILSTLTVVVGFLLFRSFLTIYWAAAAAILTAFSPHLIVMNIYLLTETLFCFLLILAVWCVARGPTLGWALAFGSLIGAACLVRPGLQYFAVVAVSVWFFDRRRVPKTQIIAMLLGLAVVLSPWFVRNRISVGSFSDDTLPILFLLHGAYPDFMYEGRPETYGFPYRFDPRAEEINQSKQAVLAEIIDRFGHEPLAMTTWYLLKKPIMFWSWNIVAGQGDVFVYPVSQSPYSSDPLFIWSHRVMKWLHTPLALLGMFGSLIVWLPLTGSMHPRKRGVARLISILLIYYTALHMIGAPFPRYSIPLRPFLYAMGAFGASFIVDRLRRSKPLDRVAFAI